jgi:hypothetical protein
MHASKRSLRVSATWRKGSRTSVVMLDVAQLPKTGETISVASLGTMVKLRVLKRITISAERPLEETVLLECKTVKLSMVKRRTPSTERPLEEAVLLHCKQVSVSGWSRWRGRAGEAELIATRYAR